MKKNYVTPVAEKISFDYRNQVVASGGKCTSYWNYSGNKSSADSCQKTGNMIITSPD